MAYSHFLSSYHMQRLLHPECRNQPVEVIAERLLDKPNTSEHHAVLKMIIGPRFVKGHQWAHSFFRGQRLHRQWRDVVTRCIVDGSSDDHEDRLEYLYLENNVERNEFGKSFAEYMFENREWAPVVQRETQTRERESSRRGTREARRERRVHFEIPRQDREPQSNVEDRRRRENNAETPQRRRDTERPRQAQEPRGNGRDSRRRDHDAEAARRRRDNEQLRRGSRDAQEAQRRRENERRPRQRRQQAQEGFIPRWIGNLAMIL